MSRPVDPSGAPPSGAPPSRAPPSGASPSGASPSAAPPSRESMSALAALVYALGRPGAKPATLDPVRARALPDDLVRRHFLAPAAYQAGVARLRKDYIASALMAELRQNLLGEVLAALGARGVEVMLFKGISYAGALYPDPALRPMSDIDLMVRAARFDDAGAALGRLGFWAAGPARQGSRLHHAVTFKRKDASVDLHRSVMQAWRSRIDMTAIWRRAQPVPGLGGVVRPEPVDEAVLHLSHIARHELCVPAINYIDAAKLLAQAGETAREPGPVLARARAFRLHRGVAAAVAMTRALTERADEPRGVIPLPSRQDVLAGQGLGRARQIACKLLLSQGPRELAGLILVAAQSRLAPRWMNRERP